MLLYKWGEEISNFIWMLKSIKKKKKWLNIFTNKKSKKTKYRIAGSTDRYTASKFPATTSFDINHHYLAPRYFPSHRCNLSFFFVVSSYTIIHRRQQQQQQQQKLIKFHNAFNSNIFWCHHFCSNLNWTRLNTLVHCYATLCTIWTRENIDCQRYCGRQLWTRMTKLCQSMWQKISASPFQLELLVPLE